MFRKNKTGLILTEALVAIGMMAIGSIILGSIITNAVSTTALSKNYLLAQNLATEGIEGVKNLRDTNWLREPEKEECWLSLNPDEVCGVEAEERMDYIVYQNERDQWIMESMAEELDLEGEQKNEGYRLFVKEIDGLYNIYVHNPSNAEPSPFFRGIKFNKITDNAATFEIKVQWKEGAKVRTIVRTVTLYNYY
ncbi:hypothetical protein GF366_01785 [Candidatus Peregrinibacteria bacterium]|nr:hypothetical protein [Candidatus Peregrinibacteria bacterium]